MNAESALQQKRQFIIALGKALHKFGTPAYRLEAHLLSVCKILKLHACFLIAPTSLTFVISEENSEQEYTRIIRVTPGELDLGSLARTDELVDEVCSGKKTIIEAIDRLNEIDNTTKHHGIMITFLAFGASSGGFAMLMNTSWNDVFWSVLLSFIVCAFIYLSEKSLRVKEMLEPISALTVAVIASAITLIDPVINTSFVILSSIIVFIPGLALTLGLAELASRHLMSGTSRIMDALMSLFKLYFGGFLGLAIGRLLWGEVDMAVSVAIPTWTNFIAVTLLSISLLILFKTRLKDAPWAMLSGYVAYGSSVWAALYIGDSLAAFVGAFVLGIYSNLFSRIMNLPSSLVKLLGLVVLVPGSKVYIGLNTAVSGQNMLNINDIGSQTFVIFMSLVAGLLFSNVALPTRKSL